MYAHCLRICLMIWSLAHFAVGGLSQSRITAAPTEESVRAAALRDLQGFLNKIPPGREIDYGFINREEFRRAEVGMAIRVFTVHPESMRAGVDPARHYMVPLNEWRVPVVVGGEFRTLLTVAPVSDRVKAVELGGELLAKEMMEFAKREPEARRALLRLYALRSDFLVIDRNGSGMEHGDIYPLRSARFVFKRLDCDASRPCSRADMYREIERQHSEAQRKDR